MAFRPTGLSFLWRLNSHKKSKDIIHELKNICQQQKRSTCFIFVTVQNCFRLFPREAVPSERLNSALFFLAAGSGELRCRVKGKTFKHCS